MFNHVQNCKIILDNIEMDKPSFIMKMPTAKPKQEECTHIQQVLNTFGLFFLVPFHIKLEEKTGNCYFNTNIFHQIICAISHVFVLASEVVFIFGVFQNKNSASLPITLFFNLVSNFAAVWLALITFKLYWFERWKIVALLESTNVSGGRSLQGKLKPILVVIVLSHSLLHTWQLLEYSGGVSKFLRIREEMSICYVPGAECSSPDMGSSSKVTGLATGILTRLTIIMVGNATNFWFLFYLQFFMLGWSMKKIGKDFGLELENTKKDVHKGIDAYLCLREKVDRINQILGSSLFYYYFTIITYLVTGPEILFKVDKNPTAEHIMLIYLIFSSCFWVITANYHNQLQQDIGRWLQYQIFQNPKSASFPPEVRMRLGSIKSEVDSGLQGSAISARYFRITNTFLSTIMGVLTTYGIIIFQTQSNKLD